MLKNRKGFTLIELLIVVVIIGILAAIAIPKFANTKEKAYLGAMKSDLRNLATAEEGYFADNQSYVAGTATNLVGNVNSVANFTPSSGVTVTVLASAVGVTPAWWSATAGHIATTKTCAMYVNTTAAQAPATVEGEPKCT